MVREVDWEKKRLFADQYDFTRESDDKETWFDIVYRNSFDSPIIISAIETSCGCLSFRGTERLCCLENRSDKGKI